MPVESPWPDQGRVKRLREVGCAAATGKDSGSGESKRLEDERGTHAMTMIPVEAWNPSSSVSSWFTVCLRAAYHPRHKQGEGGR